MCLSTLGCVMFLACRSVKFCYSRAVWLIEYADPAASNIAIAVLDKVVSANRRVISAPQKKRKYYPCEYLIMLVHRPCAKWPELHHAAGYPGFYPFIKSAFAFPECDCVEDAMPAIKGKPSYFTENMPKMANIGNAIRHSTIFQQASSPI